MESFFRSCDFCIVEGCLFHASAGKAPVGHIENGLICAVNRRTTLTNACLSKSCKSGVGLRLAGRGYENIPIAMASFLKEIDMPEQIPAVCLW